MEDKSGIKNIVQFSRYCYYAGLGIGGLALLLAGMIYAFDVDILHIFPAGPFYSATGYYCFGCGGTRAVNALLHGHLLKSFCFHPFVLYAFVVYLLYMVSHTFNILTKGKIRAMMFRPVYFYFGAILIVVQCLVKNFLLWKYGICI